MYYKRTSVLYHSSQSRVLSLEVSLINARRTECLINRFPSADREFTLHFLNMNHCDENIIPFQPIAIVGIGLRAPGSINSLESLWDTLENKKSHNARLSTDPRFLRRFNPDDFRSMFSVTPDAKETLQGNLLDETPGLDEAFFGVTERESACMDVQIKLLLHVAHEALEDAGYSATEAAGSGSAFDPTTFGVYIGSSSDDSFKVRILSYVFANKY